MNNVGEKIKGLAAGVFLIELIASIVGGFVLFGQASTVLTGVIVLVGGVIVASLTLVLLCGFGQLIEDTHAIRNKICGQKCKSIDEDASTAKEEKKIEEAVVLETVVPILDKKHKVFECPSCGSVLRKGQKKCLCNRGLDWSGIE